MGVDDIKRPDIILGGKEALDERTAHIVDVFNEIRGEGIRTAVIMNTVDAFIIRMVGVTQTGKNMDVVAFALEGTT